MFLPYFDDLLGKVNNRFLLVSIVSKRAKQIDNGSLPMVETHSKKSVTIALKELLNGKLDYVDSELSKKHKTKVIRERKDTDIKVCVPAKAGQ